MRQECIDLINKTGKFATLKRIYSSISGSTVEEFVSNASDAQVEGIIKACKTKKPYKGLFMYYLPSV